MIAQMLSISAAAAALELDSVQAGQVLLSRPSVAGALFGLLGGDFVSGLQLGLCMELLLLDQVPVGGSVPPSGVIGAACSFSLYRFFGFEGGYAFLWGFVLARLFSSVEIRLRAMRSGWNAALDEAVLERPCSVGRVLFKGIAQQFIAVLVFVGAVVIAAGHIGMLVWNALPLSVQPAFTMAYRLVPWLGLAALAALLLPRKNA